MVYALVSKKLCDMTGPQKAEGRNERKTPERRTKIKEERDRGKRQE